MINEFNDLPTRIDIDAPDRAEWKRLVVDHVRAWATWDDKTPAPVLVQDFSETPTREIRPAPQTTWLARLWERLS